MTGQLAQPAFLVAFIAFLPPLVHYSRTHDPSSKDSPKNRCDCITQTRGNVKELPGKAFRELVLRCRKERIYRPLVMTLRQGQGERTIMTPIYAISYWNREFTASGIASLSFKFKVEKYL
jgi:hypothetical protein